MKVLYNSELRKDLIGERICRLCKERHLSQQSLATKLQVLGCSSSEFTTLRIEKGQKLVTDIELKVPCNYFNARPNQMLGSDD